MTDIICWGFSEWRLFLGVICVIQFMIGVGAGYLLSKFKLKEKEE